LTHDRKLVPVRTLRLLFFCQIDDHSVINCSAVVSRLRFTWRRLTARQPCGGVFCHPQVVAVGVSVGMQQPRRDDSLSPLSAEQGRSEHLRDSRMDVGALRKTLLFGTCSNLGEEQTHGREAL
jgi:hypothetical protein